MTVTRLTVVGTGLMGASLGFAAKARGIRVTGWDPDPRAVEVAAERGAVDAAPTLAAALEGADLAVVAAPIAALPARVAGVLAATGEATTVTDVAVRWGFTHTGRFASSFRRKYGLLPSEVLRR